MKSYENLSSIYDLFMDDYDYEQIINRFDSYLKLNRVKNILDLACGTGNGSIELYRQGYNVTGIDISQEMLMHAKEKSLDENYKIKFLNADMRKFSVKSRFDAVISLTDGFNYLLTEEDIIMTLENVHKHLNDDGLLIFDMSTIYKFEEIIGNRTFAENDEASSYIWENYYDGEKHVLEFDVTVFEKNDDDDYFTRSMESHTQRGYTMETLLRLLERTNFEVIEYYGSKDNLDESDRIFYIAKKRADLEDNNG